MKKLAVAVAALALSLPALAQSTQDRPKVGLGIAIVPTVQPVRAVELYLPIRIAPQLRLEPSFGVTTSNGPGRSDTSDLTAGLGLFYVAPLASQVDMYVGGRLKLNYASTNQGAVDDSGVGVVGAGALGGEYYLVPRFSLGLEGELGFFTNPAVRGDDTGLFTTGLAFMRLYF